MPRTLKTYITTLGFFELAIAAPSMKGAIEAWGVPANVFQQGFASQTDDPKIVKATLRKPGVVLKRPVGSDDEFKGKAALPSNLPNVTLEPVRGRKPKAKKARPGKKFDKAAIISFERERAKRAAQLEKEDAKADKERAARKRAVEAAEIDLAEAETAHAKVMEQFGREQDKLQRRADLAVERWEAQKAKLEAAIVKARS